MGVAPPEAAGRINSGPPGIHAGNLDNKDLVEGTTLFIPIHVKGALFEAGDGHAGQGNGEVDITAMETSLDGTFQFIVRKDLHLKGPRGETPTHWIAMGLDPDLDQATINATRDAIDFLVTEKAPLARGRLRAVQRRGGLQHHAGGRRHQGRPRHDPEEHLQVIVVMAGLPGTGKSTLARELAAR